MEKQNIIIGQDDNLAIVRKAIRNVKKGNGGIIGIAGEPGVGKSYFLNNLIENLHSDIELDFVIVDCQHQ